MHVHMNTDTHAHAHSHKRAAKINEKAVHSGSQLMHSIHKQTYFHEFGSEWASDRMNESGVSKRANGRANAARANFMPFLPKVRTVVQINL